MSIPAYRTFGFVLLLVLTCVAAAQAPQQVARLQVTEGPTVTYVDDQFAVVAWTTNAPTESRVFYGTDADDLNRVAESKAATAHRVDLRGLKPDTTYYFQLDTGGATDAPVQQFRTVAANGAPLHRQQPAPAASAPPEPAPGVTITRGPTIEFADDRSAVISWTTSDAAPSAVYYGTRRSGLTQTAEAASGTTFHRVHLSGLEPATTYFFALDTGQGQPAGAVSNFQTAAADGQPIFNQQANQQAAPAAGDATPPVDRPLENPESQDRPRRRGGKEVPAGIEIQATLQDELSTKFSRYGDKFTAVVSQPVNATDGSLGIPAGSRITGEVVESEQGKTLPAVRGRGKLNLRFRSLILPDGTTLPLNASLISVHNMKANEEGQVQSGTSGKTAAKGVGIGAGLGTVAGLIFGGPLKGLAIGAIVGGGYVLSAKGKEVDLPPNSGMILRLEQTLRVPEQTGGG
ncbi:MAG: fibronectin type III domain-containing protein [Terriglobales bacterium]